MVLKYLLIVIVFGWMRNTVYADNLIERTQHGYVDNEGVKIHYVTIGEGPLIVMLHGFPDFWYTWRHQMKALSENYQVVAIDLRGYNKSDKPEGVDNYRMRYLIGDVSAVIQHFPQEKAIVVGHDWGGAIAWQVAMWRPNLVKKLIVLSTPHPNGLIREIRNNSQQKQNSQYARDSQKEDAHLKLTAEELALDGHAIQDDWFSPDSTNILQWVGTNIRIYNPEEKQWHMAWIDKTNRRLATFTAVYENGKIIMDGTNAKGRRIKNIFSNITQKSFDWTQQWTFDEGKSWVEVAKIHCAKR